MQQTSWLGLGTQTTVPKPVARVPTQSFCEPAGVRSLTLEQKLESVVPEGPNWDFSFAGRTLKAHLEAVIKAVRENA